VYSVSDIGGGVAAGIHTIKIPGDADPPVPTPTQIYTPSGSVGPGGVTVDKLSYFWVDRNDSNAIKRIDKGPPLGAVTILATCSASSQTFVLATDTTSVYASSGAIPNLKITAIPKSGTVKDCLTAGYAVPSKVSGILQVSKYLFWADSGGLKRIEKGAAFNTSPTVLLSDVKEGSLAIDSSGTYPSTRRRARHPRFMRPN
jgi:hypothetical protein